MVHQHVLGYSVPFDGVGDLMKEMTWKAPDQEVDQRGHGERLCK